MVVWPQTAYVGQKVVCINNSDPPNPWHRAHPLSLYAVYVIRELNFKGELHFGIDRSERLWEATRFRPANDMKTDISTLTALLNKTPTKEELVIAECVERFRECRD